MPRTEKPIDPDRGEAARFAAQLRALRAGAGMPTYRELAARTAYSVTQLSQAAAGRRLPTWPVTRAYVEACGGDLEHWKRVWEKAWRADERQTNRSAGRTSTGYSHAEALLAARPPAAAAAHLGDDAVIAYVDGSLPDAARDQATVHLAHCAQCAEKVATERVRRFQPTKPKHHVPITVVLVDDHEIVRRGVADLLEDEPDIEIIGEAATVETALALIPVLKPRVAVLDVRMPDGNGVELCRDLRTLMPDLTCLILTSYSDDEALLNAIMAGASGFVLKQVLGSDLIAAVRKVGSGESLLDAKTTQALMERIRGNRDDGGALAALTDQERAVFNLVGDGLTNRQIAARLFLSDRTVKNYVSHVLAKLGMQRRTQAAVLAAELKPRSPDQ